MLNLKLIFAIVFISSTFALSAQECYTIDRSRAEWTVPVSVEEIVPESEITLECFPNPFKGGIEIKIGAPVSLQVDLEIYDMQGNRISVLLESELAGKRTINWDGLNSKGEEVGSGAYLVKLTVGTATKTSKIVKAD